VLTADDRRACDVLLGLLPPEDAARATATLFDRGDYIDGKYVHEPTAMLDFTGPDTRYWLVPTSAILSGNAGLFLDNLNLAVVV
jgi:hypothetical protein